MYIMENVFSQVELPCSVNIPPRMLHQGLYHDLERLVKKKLEGNCVPKIGYIKPGSVQIMRKPLGKRTGSHLTGNITYDVQVRCSAAHPMKGQIIPCMVVGKNDIGVLAANYQFPAFTMFIMRTPDDASDALDRVQKNSYIEVKVLEYTLKAANNLDRMKAEYWMVCSLANAKAAAERYHILPMIPECPTLLANPTCYDLMDINAKRDELSNKMYGTLETTKRSIQTIRSEYLKLITTDPELSSKDFFIQSMIGRSKGHYVIGKLRSLTQEDKECIHSLDVIHSTRPDIIGKEISISIPLAKSHKKPDQRATSGDIMLYVDYLDGTAKSHQTLDLWGRHVKYIVNTTEMVHANVPYVQQLTNIMCSRGDVKFDRNGRVQSFKDKKTGKPVATVIGKNPHVLNRAYYKMKELMDFFGESVFLNRDMKIACIAECPGGFIQAMLDTRMYNPSEDHPVDGYKDDIACISIGINCPPWQDLADKVRKSYKFVHLRCDKEDSCEKQDGKTNLLLIGSTKKRDDPSGDILLRESRERFYEEFKDGGADLVTGDAGIERNKAESTEEMDTHRLLIAEIIMALTCQKPGGCFILKIYDMATELTMNLLEVLSFCYEEIGLFKPNTSRAASSEKYLVCKNLHVSDDVRKDLVLKMEKIIDSVPREGTYYANMIAVPDSKLKEAITNYNSYYMGHQAKFIEEGRRYALLYNNALNAENSDKMFYNILGRVGLQTSTAQDFYETVGMKVPNE